MGDFERQKAEAAWHQAWTNVVNALTAVAWVAFVAVLAVAPAVVIAVWRWAL